MYRGAALKCLTLIAFWSFAAAGLRVTDYLIAVSLDLPHRIYDSFALTAFNVVTGCVAVWLKGQLAKGGLTSTVIAAFSAVLSVFTVAQLVIGVALAPRYAEPVPRSPDAIYGNDLAQQLTSTFDVVVCVLSLAILVGRTRHRSAGGLRAAPARNPGRGPGCRGRFSDHRHPPHAAEDGPENRPAERGFDQGARRSRSYGHPADPTAARIRRDHAGAGGRSVGHGRLAHRSRGWRAHELGRRHTG